MSSANAKAPAGELRDLRRSLGLSQEALARRAHCSTAMVRLLERGYQPLGGEVLPRVVSILNDFDPAATGSKVKERDDAAHTGS